MTRDGESILTSVPVGGVTFVQAKEGEQEAQKPFTKWEPKRQDYLQVTPPFQPQPIDI